MKRSKYGSRKTEVDGHIFDSKKESEHYSNLRLLEMAGLITDLELQVKFEININGKHICTYIADFVYFENGQKIISDVKGFRTPVYKLKKKLVEAVYGIQISEV